jgi:hypothetical protein
MKKKRDIAYGAFSLFVMADKALIATSGVTPNRLSMTIEPIEIFDYRNRDEFLAAAKRAAARGIPQVDMPPDDELFWHEDGMPGRKTPIELKYAQVKNWDELERKSVYFTVDCYDRGYVVISCGRNKNGLWNDDVALELRMPATVGMEGVVDAILDHLKTRKDLPGMKLDFNQPRTAKGA